MNRQRRTSRRFWSIPRLRHPDISMPGVPGWQSGWHLARLLRGSVCQGFSGRFLQWSSKRTFFGNPRGGTGSSGTRPATAVPPRYVLGRREGVPRGIQGIYRYIQGIHHSWTLYLAVFRLFSGKVPAFQASFAGGGEKCPESGIRHHPSSSSSVSVVRPRPSSSSVIVVIRHLLLARRQEYFCFVFCSP